MKIGDIAPDFTAVTAAGSVFRLSSELKNNPVVLVFYPFAFSNVCDGEVAEIIESLSEFGSVGVSVFLISCDSTHSLAKYAATYAADPDIFLSDYWPHGAIAEKFGVLSDKGYAERKTFFISRNGNITDALASNITTPRSICDTLEKARKIKEL